MQTPEHPPDNQYNYQRLMAAIEASAGSLNLLVAACNTRNLRQQLVRQYEAELQQQGIVCHRLRLRGPDPSLRQALVELVAAEPALQTGQHATITVLGIDELLPVKFDAPQSEQDRFFGYLQWTREALLHIVVWLNPQLLVRLAERAPDFWSWRGGVFWFEDSPTSAVMSTSATWEGTFPPSSETHTLPVEDLLSLIAQIEQQQGQDASLLVTLYDSLGRAYNQRYRGKPEATRHCRLPASNCAAAPTQPGTAAGRQFVETGSARVRATRRYSTGLALL